MGSVKAMMMEAQEMLPMYDWIEENYELDRNNQDSDEWLEAVLAYGFYCDGLYEDEVARNAMEEAKWYVHSRSQASRFYSQMDNVSEILKVNVSGSAQFSLLVMLHGHIISSIEGYLASSFIHHVVNSELLMRKLVETDPAFREMKFTLKEIYEQQEELKLTVAKHLKELVFHRISAVKPMFKNVLDYDFGDIGWLFQAVKIRHHCVHRAGEDKDGRKVNINNGSIRELVEKSTALVNSVEEAFHNISDSEPDF